MRLYFDGELVPVRPADLAGALLLVASILCAGVIL